MVSAKVIIKNPQGLHARPAGIIANAAMGCSSQTILIHGEKRIQMKSILSVMSATVKFGNVAEIECDGESEQEDLQMLVKVFDEQSESGEYN